ncbi:cytochrome c [bacterium]|nr:cytochrome c [bacterium]
MKLTTKLILLLFACSFNRFVFAQEKEADYKLSGKQKVIYHQEMVKIDSAMAKMTRYLAKGDFVQLRKTAQDVRNNFVLKSKLTLDEKKVMETKLSKKFKTMEANFYRHLAKLAEVAKRRDLELSHFYFDKVLKDCTNCHKNTTPEKFTNFFRKKKTTTTTQTQGKK